MEIHPASLGGNGRRTDTDMDRTVHMQYDRSTGIWIRTHDFNDAARDQWTAGDDCLFRLYLCIRIAAGDFAY